MFDLYASRGGRLRSRGNFFPSEMVYRKDTPCSDAEMHAVVETEAAAALSPPMHVA